MTSYIDGRSRSGVTLTTLLAATALLPGVVTAQPSPEAVVRERNEAVERILDAVGDSIVDEERQELKDVINGLIDFRELSRRALRDHWEARTPEEQDDFVDVFRSLVRNSSVRKLEVYEADSVTYDPASIQDGQARVLTVAHDDGTAIEVEYLMHRVDGEWLAYDVIIDGSSTLRTYQDSFQREIEATSYEAMYQRLVERLAEENGSTD